MARCPYLEYESNNYISTSDDKFICKLCGYRFDYDDSKVKYICNAEYGEEYKKCDVYKTS